MTWHGTPPDHEYLCNLSPDKDDHGKLSSLHYVSVHPEHDCTPHIPSNPKQHNSEHSSRNIGDPPIVSQSHPSNSVSVAPIMGTPGSSTFQEASLIIPDSFSDNTRGFNFDQWSPDLSFDQSSDDWAISTLQITFGCKLFFSHVADFLPFIHFPTFDPDATPQILLLGMLCLAYQYGEDPIHNNKMGSGIELSSACFHRARRLITIEEHRSNERSCDDTLIQTYLFLQIYAMMYSDDEVDSAYGLKTHSKMISLARASGLMQPWIHEPNAAEDLDTLWKDFVQKESRKRTVYAVHQIDTLWYQVLSIPRSLSHLEIKYDLPCLKTYWKASSCGEWAHRQLLTRQSSPTIQYQDAVRRILASNRDVNPLPEFDLYGAINITQFLISSAREISGWSTMTGMLSLERLEPIRMSLLAISPLVHAQAQETHIRHSDLCEGTWETAMIEMQMWSPSHTGGIVGDSMDAAMHQLVYLSPSLEFLLESNLAESIQPHIDWFLRYLDKTIVPDSEAPWMMLYAYKAFIIAWQLISGSIKGAMQVVGVRDGDTKGAIAWAKKVFKLRERLKLGKIVLACLSTLVED